MLWANHDSPAAVRNAVASRAAMEATTAALGDLNDVSIYARRRRRQRHGVGNTEGRNGSSEKCCCEN
jgi:hypothetical protein